MGERREARGERHEAKGKGRKMSFVRTGRKNEEQAMLFWLRVRDGEELRKSMPEYRLRLFLMQVFRGKKVEIRNTGKKVTEKEILAKSIQAWNAFRNRETMRSGELKYDPNKPIPEAV